MKVLFLNYEFPPLGGGGGTTTKYLGQKLIKQGVEIKVLTGGYKGLPEREWQDGYEIIRVKTGRKQVSGSSQLEMFIFVLLAIRPMFKLIREWQPDLVHCFFAMPTGILGWLAKRIARVPYLVYILGDVLLLISDYDTNNRNTIFKKILIYLNSRILNYADLVFTNSIGLNNLTHKFFPDKKTDIITNGIELSNFYPAKRKEDKNNILTFLFVGRFVAQKGLIILLAALDITINKYGMRNLKLLVAGDGDEKNIYLNYIKEKNLESYIKFLGWVKLEELNDIYNQADVFVLASNFEGMPSVVLQAMACGLPVVSTKVYGSEDLVADGKNGFLVEINDSLMMAEKIMEFIKHPEYITSMGQDAEKMIKDFSWDKIAGQFKTQYEKLLSK